MEDQVANKLSQLSEGISIAVAGATGEVGREMLKVLEKRNFPIRKIYLLASSAKPGRTLSFNGEELPVTAIEDFDFEKTTIVLMAMNGDLAREYAPKAASRGNFVVDNSSAFRLNDDCPLVISEVNAEAIYPLPPIGIIANPNCSTMQLLVALNPIHKEVGIKSISVATYQSVSGAGASGIDELREQTTAMLNGQKPDPAYFQDVIGFNMIPHIDTFQDNGFTREEMKIVWETHKILNDPDINVTATAVRVPVFYGHGEAVQLFTKEPLSADDARELLAKAPGVIVIDEHVDGGYPTPVTHAAGNDEVFVGRIRDDLWDSSRGLHMWIVADNIRKGAALNAVQLAEHIAVQRNKRPRNPE